MSIEDVMLQAVKQGFNIDEKTVRHNVDYFKHNLNMCSCAICECGTCQCKNPRFQLTTSFRRRSVTPKIRVRDTPITVSRSFYETFENSYRQMRVLPNQFITSNQRQYRGFSLTGTPASSYVASILPQTPFEGSTRYKEFFTDKLQLKSYHFKRPYDRHTGPLKGQMETQNQREFRRVKLEPQKQPVPPTKMDTVLGVNLSIPMKTMYQTSFREFQEVTQSVDSKPSRQRRQEDLECINQITLPFQARSTSNSAYRQQALFIQQIKQFKELFAMFDKDGGGTISTLEIGNLMKECGENPTPQQLNEMIQEVDVDGNGEVDFDEFIGLMGKRMREEETNDELSQAFTALDMDKDGYLSKQDIQLGLVKLGAQKIPDVELDELFMKADLDKDGKFSFDEFIRFMTPK